MALSSPGELLGETQRGNRSRLLAVVLCCLGAFVAFLDSTIVNIAFPDIARDFHSTSLSGLSWVLNAYNVLIAALLMPIGRLADRSGVRRAFVLGLLVFSLASLACAASSSVVPLVLARCLQAVGAATLIPTSLALLLPLFPLHQRLTAMALWGAAAALAAGLGPALGGVLVQAVSWRAVFLVNVPLGLIAGVLARRFLGEQRDPSTRTPDVVGTVLLAAALGVLALAVVQGPSWGWSSARVLVAGCGGAAGLIIVALRCRRHVAPVIDPAALRSRAAAMGNVGTFLFATAFFAAILNNVLFLTRGWGWSVLHAAFALTPSPLLTAVTARPAGRIADRVGARTVIVPGCLVYAGGTLLLAWGAGHSPDFLTHWLPGAACVGVGIGLAFPNFTGIALSAVEPRVLATASATNAAARQLGGVLGTALLVSVLASRATDPLAAARAGWTLVVALAATALCAAIALPRPPRVA